MNGTAARTWWNASLGNLLGAALSAGAIDHDLLAQLEGGDIITQVADDLHDVFAGGRPPDGQRYCASNDEQDLA